jgi:hypothetical protein
VYELFVVGPVTEEHLTTLRSRFGDVLTAAEPAGSVLTGAVADQAALVGMLEHLHGLGLEVRELRRMAGSTPADDWRAPTRFTNPA